MGVARSMYEKLERKGGTGRLGDWEIYESEKSYIESATPEKD